MENISKNLQLGKAGEHLVCYDLIMRGYNAFLADQGLNFDVVIATKTKLYKVQVKSTQKKVNAGKVKNVYRFHAKSAKKGNRRFRNDVDIVAFVALDKKIIGYLFVNDYCNPDGFIKIAFDFRDRDDASPVILKINGMPRKQNCKSKYLQDFNTLNLD